MTHLTEAEKAQGWTRCVDGFSCGGEYGDVAAYPTDIEVCVGGGDGGAPLHEKDVDDLILALLQAKGIHRRLRAEMTNTTHGGTDGH